MKKMFIAILLAGVGFLSSANAEFLTPCCEADACCTTTCCTCDPCDPCDCSCDCTCGCECEVVCCD